jgi:methionyl-tRNA formyltransferase
LRVAVSEPRTDYPQPGMILDDLSIACAPGSLRLLEVQPPGGKVMAFDAYRRGQPVIVGSKVEST